MRLVACDLDGTVVRADGTISARTLAAFEACTAAGVEVLFVTGRPPRWMPPIAEATGHSGIAVCGNGAVLYDLASEQVLHAYGLAPAMVQAAADRLRASMRDAVFAMETLQGYRREPGFVPHHDAAAAALCGQLPDLLADAPVVVKLLCRVESLRADAILARARRLLVGIAEPVHSDPRGSLLEVSAIGVSKASTLATLVAERGLTAEDVVAFGDMPNDVAMLRWAGRGVAVADGHREAIGAADEVAPACADDGVARVLERLLAVTP